VLFTSVFGFLIAIGLGFDLVPSVYIAVALTFSSTIIIVKLLTDKRELDDLHGRIALGFLIVQDIVVVLAMIAITAFGDGEGGPRCRVRRGRRCGRGAAASVSCSVGRYVAPRVTHLLARSSELLVLAAVTWAVALAASRSCSASARRSARSWPGCRWPPPPTARRSAGRLSTLRDFLLVFFFIELGTQFELGTAVDQLGPRWSSRLRADRQPDHRHGDHGGMGYRKRVSFKAGSPSRRSASSR
jgi:predicted Kef-type K+ transport protein